MGISIFYLPNYKSMLGVGMDTLLKGRCSTCLDKDMEGFKPIWGKIISGRFPGNLLKLKRRILDKEYSMYPIVFIDSHYWCAEKDTDAHGYTSVFVVQKQVQNLDVCKSYENRFIDRELGVIILDKTTIHGKGEEPDYKNWFYEKDARKPLPDNILTEEFSEKGPGVFLSIEKYADDGEIDFNTEVQYVRRSGYLHGENIMNLVKTDTLSDESPIGCLLIQWPDSWNFMVRDNYGVNMYRVSNPDAEAFLERIKF